MCDVVYVLLLDRLERQVLADRQVAALQAVMSREGGKLPSFEERRAEWDAALAAEPRRLRAVDSEQAELHRALGVA